MFEVKLISFTFCAFFAVLFIQSGLDKFMDREGNLEYIRGVFSKSPLKNFSDTMFIVISFMEIAAGALCGFSAIGALFISPINFPLPFYAMALSSLNLIALFFGQRMAKDYQGAAGIVPYFIASMFGMVVFSTFG